MPAFAYKAMDANGKNSSGVLEADNPRQVRQQLREKSLIPVSVDEVSGRSTSRSSRRSAGWFQKGISAADLALLTRQLSTLIEASLPIEEALQAVAEQTEQPRHKSMMMAVRSKVVEGHTLADALADFPRVFDNLFVAMVAAGEKSGHLDTVLDRLADYTENRNKVRSQITQALVYPIMMITVAIGIVSILMIYVVPKIISQFDNMGQELPLITRILIGISEGVQSYGLLLLLILVAAGFTVGQMLRRPALRMRWDKAKLKLPVIGKVIKGLNTSRFASTLSILTASAVPLLEGMKIAANVLDNRYIRASILEAAERVKEGSSLRAALQKTAIFPPMMMHMIASGERSGELQSMLARAAANQDRQFEAQVAIALSIFGPVLILSMAAIVFFIVAAILLPIIGLNTMI